MIDNRVFGGLDARINNILLGAGYDTKEKLASASSVSLLKLEGIGHGSLRHIDDFLGRESYKKRLKVKIAIEFLTANGYRIEKI